MSGSCRLLVGPDYHGKLGKPLGFQSRLLYLHSEAAGTKQHGIRSVMVMMG